VQPQRWGEDSDGTDEPFTVLAPVGETAQSRNAVVISVTGFRGNEGGLSQAALGYNSRSVESFTIDGRRAMYSPQQPAQLGRSWVDLVAVKGDDLAVRVTSRHATRSQLVDVLRRVQPRAGHERAPRVSEPPHGLRVVGSVDVDMVIALTGYIQAGVTGGRPDTHTAGWFDDPGRLAVMTLPGRAADLAAVVAVARFLFTVPAVVRHEHVGGRDAVVLDLGWNREEGPSIRDLVTTTTWGDLLVVRSQGSSLRSIGSLVDIAGSVRPVNEQTWQRFVARAR
jgi:hypothetical protein